MPPAYSISVIIPVYKRLDFLELILLALEKQSYTNFEVVIAEDDDSEETKKFLSSLSNQLSYKIKHVFQEDSGFRKNKALNNALRVAVGELIIFIDGDCIPHKHFLKQYIKNIKSNLILFGRRVMLGQKTTVQLTKHRNIFKLNFLSLLFSNTKRLEDGLYLPWIVRFKKSYRGFWGCNWGVMKEHLVAINGFDEDYVKAGFGEDVDVEWRLLSNGLELQSLKNKAIVYHLHHKENYSTSDIEYNRNIYTEKRSKGIAYCVNGLYQ